MKSGLLDGLLDAHARQCFLRPKPDKQKISQHTEKNEASSHGQLLIVVKKKEVTAPRTSSHTEARQFEPTQLECGNSKIAILLKRNVHFIVLMYLMECGSLRQNPGDKILRPPLLTRT